MRRRGRSDGNVRVTIEQVAKLARVSTATASRALNHPNSVSDALRERVGAAVARLEYIPNQTARALSSLRSGLVGALVPAIDTRYAQMLEAIELQLDRAGYGMLLVAVGDDGARATDAAKAMAAREPEGLLMLGVEIGDVLCAFLNARRICHVSVDAGGSAPKASRVDITYLEGGETVGRYLLGLGHRTLAFVDGLASSPRRSAGLLQGLRAALAASGTAEPPQRVLAADVVAIRAALRQWLTAASPPTALMCGDDIVALAVLRECAVLGVIVPDRLSIVGCGDLSFARYATPPLSTLRVPAAMIGAAAVDQLLARLAGGLPSAQSVPIKLVVRHSSGPAPA